MTAALNFFETRIAPPMHRLGELPFVAAVRDALPWSFCGLAAGFVIFFTVQTLSAPIRSESAALRLTAALLPSFSLMALSLTVLLGLRLARRTGYGIVPVLLASIGGFALSLPRPYGPDPVSYLRTLGASGIFLAIVACGVAGAAIAAARRLMPSRPADWIGAASAIAFFVLLLVVRVSPAAVILQVMQPMARLGDSYAALMIIVLVETLLWTAGVHGPAILSALLTPVYLTMQIANTHAFGSHAPLPYIVVVSVFLFIFPGGAGATLSLAALLAVSRVPRLQRIGRVTLVPALFNVNDPLLFGAPVVFNPFFVLPFIGTPLVLATVTYVAIAAGLVARAAFYVPSFVPAPLATYVATQDLRAVVLTLLNIGLSLVIYYPFVRAYERHLSRTQPA
jgi:cellobiose PTS system EIIC component